MIQGRSGSWLTAMELIVSLASASLHVRGSTVDGRMTWEPGDILDFDRRAAWVYPERTADIGLTVLHRGSGYRGKIARFEQGAVVLRGPTGGERLFPLVPGAFAVDGDTVT